MKNKLIDDFILNIQRSFCENNLLNSQNNIVQLKKFLRGKDFKELLNNKIKSNSFTSEDALFLSIPLMQEMLNITPYNNFLNDVYTYTLSKSFIELKGNTLDINKPAFELYLLFLREVSNLQKLIDDGTWQSRYPLNFLSSDEIKDLENNEYIEFINSFSKENIYEMMKLNQEIMGYNTLDHICGVHYLSLFIGRQIKEKGINIDLGRVSGSAAGHDIGKYGCKPHEASKVPYLHYYYTDVWFKRHNIDYIRNIAINHSTWDLELENLSIESLILIYCDFRVKNYVNDSGKLVMKIFTLDSAFDVILSKLDNVDDKKLQRYRRVYRKLKDFEDFLYSNGICLDIDNNDYLPCSVKKYYELMQGDEVIGALKNLSILHNVSLMWKLRDESSLNNVLEKARSEENTENLRAYLQVFEEYSTYMTQKQKLIALKFFYDKLIHSDEDIRIQCSELMGKVIAYFDEEYRKDIPEDGAINETGTKSPILFKDFLLLMIYPDHKIITMHRRWIGNLIPSFISSLFKNSKDKYIGEYIDILFSCLKDFYDSSSEICIYLLEALKSLPKGNKIDYTTAFKFIYNNINLNNQIIRLCSLETLLFLLNEDFFKDKKRKIIRNYLSLNCNKSERAAENYIKLKLGEAVSLDEKNLSKYNNFTLEDFNNTPEIFLSNLKSATDRITKKIQIDILVEYCTKYAPKEGLYAAMHFCNILKVSETASVRNHGGEALIKILPYLSKEQINDVTVELLRALEIDGYQITKYIPQYLGRVILFLKPIELNEVIDDLILKTKLSSSRITSLLLKTIGFTLCNYKKYIGEFDENSKAIEQLLGIILNGIANYDMKISQNALSVLGRDIFNSSELSLEEKYYILRLTAKKTLTLIHPFETDLLLMNNAASLNHIYRFISDYSFFNGGIHLRQREKAAFFPGTFDPYSLSHREIVSEILKLGFEVYLAVDEFSWSKRTLPNKLRRQVLNMSEADEFNVFIFPEDIPINISSGEDLKNLKKCLNKMVYIVVGSDVIVNASAYNLDKEEIIYNFPHIIFERRSSSSYNSEKLKERIKKFKTPPVMLNLEPRYEDISSTQIRESIDYNRDISRLVDPMVQKFIYENNLYRKETQYKRVIQPVSLNIEIFEHPDGAIIDEILSFLISKEQNIRGCEDFIKVGKKFLIIRDKNSNNIIGLSIFSRVASSSLYNSIKDTSATQYIREHSTGRILFIEGIYVDKKIDSSLRYSLTQIILTETLSYYISKDYSYAVFKGERLDFSSPELLEILELNGFLSLDNKMGIFGVDISTPSVIILDALSFIKEPFRNNPIIVDKVFSLRKKLLGALIKLYPGKLMLSFDRNILYQKLIDKICRENDVPPEPIVGTNKGNYMCVPFGSILKRYIVPNTVTKSLHTEKIFDPSMNSFKIEALPLYLSLENQVKTIGSFNKSVILVDDILHKGYRLKVIDPIFKSNNIKIKKIIVGIMSGRGKELMDIQGRSAACAYLIPNLKIWFNENLLYPFLGGDVVRRDGVKLNVVPSVNLLLPYTYPVFMRGAEMESILNLSRVCLENTIELLETLEKEYENYYERTLTLSLLGDVFVYPRYPDHGKDLNYDFNLSPSHYVRNDLELLMRLSKTFI